MFPCVLRDGVVMLDPRELGEDGVVAVYDGIMLDRQLPDVRVSYRIEEISLLRFGRSGGGDRPPNRRFS